MTELIQKRFWDKRHFQLMDDVVQVRMKTPTEDAEFSVKYEELGFETVIVRKKDASLFFSGLMYLTCFVGIAVIKNIELDNIVNMILFFAFFLFFIFTLYLASSDSRKQLLGINGGEKSLALLRSSPNEQTVDLFVKELHERIKNTIIRKRLRPNDASIDFEYKKMLLDDLKESGILNNTEYEGLLAQISVKTTVIGFLSQTNTDSSE